MPIIRLKGRRAVTSAAPPIDPPKPKPEPRPPKPPKPRRRMAETKPKPKPPPQPEQPQPVEDPPDTAALIPLTANGHVASLRHCVCDKPLPLASREVSTRWDVAMPTRCLRCGKEIAGVRG